MTTTPTLLIQIRSVTSAGNVNYKTRPATHDELIAAMPRCGTCDFKTTRHALGYPGIPTRIHTCTNKDSHALAEEVGLYFGCTEHKPKETM